MKQRVAAFTLLEVMVAMAILALSLTTIYSSEAGAVKVARRARTTGMATLLARCKMGEIEEQIASEGLPALDDSGSDACCEEGEVEGYDCDWELVPIVLPDTMFAPEEEGEGGGALDTLASARDEAKELDPTELLSGGGFGGLASMALGFVFPVLKPAFESQIRRATVTVHWREGDVPHELEVTQYVVSGTPAPEAVAEPPPEGAPPGGP
jgi:general secretion pathway protein I